MKELIQKLCRIPDVYDDFILGVINYAKKKPEHIKLLNEYMDTHLDISTSDVVFFISTQPDFHSYSAANKLIIAWDPDYTRVTPDERKRIDKSYEEIKNGIYYTDEEVWNEK